MKRLFVLVLAVFSLTHSYAQKTDVISLPKGARVGVLFDYSGSIIKGSKYNDYCRFDDTFVEEKGEAEDRFVERINKRYYQDIDVIIQQASFTNRRKLKNETPAMSFARWKENTECNLFLSICPERIEENGSFLGHAILLDSQRDTLLRIERIKKNGGHYGSFINLLGDGYEEVAETVSRTLAKAAVKSAKNK